jgi:ribosome maturation factor RimP
MRGVASIVEQVKAAVTPIAEGYGLELFDVQFRREAYGMVLRVQIDRPGSKALPEDGVTVEDCSHVSRDLSALLDVEDFIPGNYTLEVSSPGLDRPLRGQSDFERFAGRLAKLVSREAVDGQTFFRGRLGGVESEMVLIEVEGGREHRVPLALVSRANLEVEF